MMKQSGKRWLSRLTIAVLAVIVALSVGACDNGGGSSKEPEGPSGGTAQAPVITSFTIEADTASNAVRGKVNHAHKLNWNITGDCTATTITVKKNQAEAVKDTDYEYVEQAKKITFKTVGQYTVTLKAVNGAKSMSKNAEIAISEFAAPTITLPQDISGYIDEATDFAPVITYDPDDAADEQTVAVTFTPVDGTEQTVTDNAAYYTLADGRFTPKQKGEYCVTIAVVSAQGKSASAVWTMTALEPGDIAANVVEDEDWQKEDGKILVEKGKATDFAYTVAGYLADRFDVTVALKKGDEDRSEQVTHAAETRTLTVTAAEEGVFVLTITFTAKEDATATSTATWNLCVKNDIHAPVLGADAFGGTHTALKPNVGMVLYFDATDDKVQPLTYRNVTYTVVAESTTAAGAEIVDDGAYADYPYVIATGEGKITVRLSVSDGTNTVTEEKEFTVAQAGDSYDAYFKTVYPGTDNMFSRTNSGIWVDGFNGTTEQANAATTLIATKNGLLSSHGDTVQNASLLGVFIGDQENFTISFDFTLLHVAAGFNTLWFTPHVGGSGIGNIGFNWNATNPQINGSFSDAGVGAANSTHASVAKPTVGSTVKMRLQKAGTVWTVALSSDGGSTYAPIITATAAQSQVVKQVFFWGADAGDFLIENIVPTIG